MALNGPGCDVRQCSLSGDGLPQSTACSPQGNAPRSLGLLTLLIMRSCSKDASRFYFR
jgi:hypothetical protein